MIKFGKRIALQELKFPKLETVTGLIEADFINARREDSGIRIAVFGKDGRDIEFKVPLASLLNALKSVTGTNE